MQRSLILFIIVSCFAIVSIKLFAERNNSISGNQKIIALDFRKIPLKELLQFMAEAMNYNIIMSDSVSGNVSLHFRNITWQQAFDVSLEMTGFVKKQVGNILLIATPVEFANRQKNISEAAAVKTIRKKLCHVDVNQVIPSLKAQLDILSPAARISSDTQDNSLLIKEIVDNIPLVMSYIRQIDVPEKQLLISSKVVNVDDKKINELGITFNSRARQNSSKDLQISLPGEHTCSFNVAIANFAQTQLLNLELEALEATGHSKIIADPKIITQNHKPATIETGEEIPYQEKTSSGATSTVFKKAVLSLKVLPTILPDRRIILELEINQNKVAALSINGTPAIQTQELKTQVIVRDGETLILGGIFETTQSNMIHKLPLLGDLPLLGPLLSHAKKEQLRKELLILVTPQILSMKAKDNCN